MTLSAPRQVPSPACLWNQGSFTVSRLSRLSVLLAFSLTVRVKGHRLWRSEGKAASCPEKQLRADVPKAGDTQQLQLGMEKCPAPLCAWCLAALRAGPPLACCSEWGELGGPRLWDTAVPQRPLPTRLCMCGRTEPHTLPGGMINITLYRFWIIKQEERNCKILV